MSDLKTIALKVYDAFFHDHDSVEIDGDDYRIWKTSRAHLRYVQIERYNFIEKNPNKASRWAKMTQEGHQILWVREGLKYLATVRDGKYYDLKRTEG